MPRSCMPLLSGEQSQRAYFQNVVSTQEPMRLQDHISTCDLNTLWADMAQTIMVTLVLKVHTSPRNSAWFTTLFLRRWDLGTRLSKLFLRWLTASLIPRLSPQKRSLGMRVLTAWYDMTDISLSFLICSRSSSSRSCKREQHTKINQLIFKVWLIFHPPCIIALSWSHSHNNTMPWSHSHNNAMSWSHSHSTAMSWSHSHNSAMSWSHSQVHVCRPGKDARINFPEIWRSLYTLQFCLPPSAPLSHAESSCQSWLQERRRNENDWPISF